MLIGGVLGHHALQRLARAAAATAGVERLAENRGPAASAATVPRRAPLTSRIDAARIEPEDVIGKRADQRAQLAVGLQQLLRAEVERALEHRAIVVELLVGLVDGGEHRLELRRHAIVGKVAFQLAAQQAVQLGHRHRSERVVTVMVWLCSSQRAFGVNGEISPYE